MHGPSTLSFASCAGVSADVSPVSGFGLIVVETFDLGVPACVWSVLTWHSTKTGSGDVLATATSARQLTA